MNIKLKLVPTTRTDLPCAGCGGFLLRSGRGKSWAIVSPEAANDELANVGLHRECKDVMNVRRQKKEKSDA